MFNSFYSLADDYSRHHSMAQSLENPKSNRQFDQPHVSHSEKHHEPTNVKQMKK